MIKTNKPWTNDFGGSCGGGGRPGGWYEVILNANLKQIFHIRRDKWICFSSHFSNDNFMYLFILSFLCLTSFLDLITTMVSTSFKGDWQLLHDVLLAGPISTKLMRLGLTNWIIDDSDFKPVNFDRRFQSDSKSNDEFESTIAISI